MPETDPAYKMFARMYPHEAYEQDPQKFCNLVREKNPHLTNQEILDALNETKDIGEEQTNAPTSEEQA